MRPLAAAVVQLAILLVAGEARAADAGEDTPRAAPDPLPAGSTAGAQAAPIDPVTAWLSAPPPPTEPGAPHHVRPILLVGVGGGLGGSDLWLGADLGLRIDWFTGRAAWRLLTFGGDYATYTSGRVGVVVLERRWIALTGALGGGELTRTYAGGPSTNASGTAGSFDLGVLVGPRWAAGPLFSLSLEAIFPVGGGAPIGGPTVAVYGTVNIVALLLTSMKVPPDVLGPAN